MAFRLLRQITLKKLKKKKRTAFCNIINLTRSATIFAVVHKQQKPNIVRQRIEKVIIFEILNCTRSSPRRFSFFFFFATGSLTLQRQALCINFKQHVIPLEKPAIHFKVKNMSYINRKIFGNIGALLQKKNTSKYELAYRLQSHSPQLLTCIIALTTKGRMHSPAKRQPAKVGTVFVNKGTQLPRFFRSRRSQKIN